MQHFSVIDSSLFTKLWVSRFGLFLLAHLAKTDNWPLLFPKLYLFPFVGGAPPPAPACMHSSSFSRGQTPFRNGVWPRETVTVL